VRTALAVEAALGSLKRSCCAAAFMQAALPRPMANAARERSTYRHAPAPCMDTRTLVQETLARPGVPRAERAPPRGAPRPMDLVQVLGWRQVPAQKFPGVLTSWEVDSGSPQRWGWPIAGSPRACEQQ
jgi:hypothetical protein